MDTNFVDNIFKAVWCQVITWLNADTLSIGSLGINFNEIFMEIQSSSLKKMHLKMLSARYQPFPQATHESLGLNKPKGLRQLIFSNYSQVPL